MKDTPMLNPQILGKAENAHRALLDRILAGTGLSYQSWVGLTLTAAGGAPVGRETIISRMTDALKINETGALAALAKLSAASLLEAHGDRGVELRLTESGRQRYGEIRSAIGATMARLYDGIALADLAVAGRVLALLTARANAELHSTQVTLASIRNRN